MRGTARQQEEMKKQTIGVEVECYGIERRKAAKIAADFFGTRYQNTEGRNGYRTWSAWDTQGREWKFSRDSSIMDSDDRRCEMVTPILTYEDIPTLQELIRKLRHAGAKSDPEHICGVHIHIGANGHDARSLRNLANLMASHEELLAKSIGVSPSRQRFCKTVDHNFLKKLNAKKPDSMGELADLWYGTQDGNSMRGEHYNLTRYHMLNLHSVFTKGTIEFRLFQFDAPTEERKGGLHAGQLKAYIQLCLALSQMAKDSSRISPKPQQTENQKFAMRTWLMRLGFIGEEFATAREVFLKRLSGNAAFRSGSRPAA